jgi:hypothetical protein
MDGLSATIAEIAAEPSNNRFADRAAARSHL